MKQEEADLSGGRKLTRDHGTVVSADPLTRLAIEHGTDKFGPHNYTPIYYDLFGAFTEHPIRLLEIGVGGYKNPAAGGASLKMWRDFFRRGSIVGIDIEEKYLELGERIVIEVGSQDDPVFLSKIDGDHGPFDIVIDDGSHLNTDVIRSFEVLFERLAPGGIYVVEDTQTAYFPKYGGSVSLDMPNSVRYFFNLTESLLSGGPYSNTVSEVWRFHNLIVIQKIDRRTSTDPSLVRNFSSVEALEINLHKVIDEIGIGDTIRLEYSRDLQERFFVLFNEFDFHEIAVGDPEVAISDLSKSIVVLRARENEIFLTKGRNDYPSNFRFDPENSEASDALRLWKDTLRRSPTEHGLQSLGDFSLEIGWMPGLLFSALILEEQLCHEEASLRLIIEAAIAAGDDERHRKHLDQAKHLFPDSKMFRR